MAGQWPNWGPCLILTSVLLSMVMHCSSRSGVTKIALQSRLATLQTAESLLSSVSLLAWQDSKPPLEIHQHSARVLRAIFIISQHPASSWVECINFSLLPRQSIRDCLYRQTVVALCPHQQIDSACVQHMVGCQLVSWRNKDDFKCFHRDKMQLLAIRCLRTSQQKLCQQALH